MSRGVGRDAYGRALDRYGRERDMLAAARVYDVAVGVGVARFATLRLSVVGACEYGEMHRREQYGDIKAFQFHEVFVVKGYEYVCAAFGPSERSMAGRATRGSSP